MHQKQAAQHGAQDFNQTKTTQLAGSNSHAVQKQAAEHDIQDFNQTKKIQLDGSNLIVQYSNQKETMQLQRKKCGSKQAGLNDNQRK